MFCPYCGRKIEITDYIDEKIDVNRAVDKEYEVWHPSLEDNADSISWTPHSWSSDYDNIRNIRR